MNLKKNVLVTLDVKEDGVKTVSLYSVIRAFLIFKIFEIKKT